MPPDTSAADERPEETHPSAHPADQATARKFLEFILSDYAGGFVEFRYFTSGRRPKVTGKPSYYALPLNYEESLAEVLAENGQRMITVGLAPRCRVPAKGGIGKSQDVLQVNCLWANLDNRRARGGPLEIVRRIHEFPLRPSVTVNSGYGYHLYFVFREPFGGSLLLEWGEMMRGLGDALHAPDKIDISQVMRLPGTLNVKEEHPVACEIVEEYSAWARYGINDVKSAIDEAAARAQPSAAPARRARVDHDDDLNFAEDDLPPGYYREDDGSVWFSPPAEEGARKAPRPVKVSNSPVYISRIQENVDTGQVSLTLSFDYLGRKRSVTTLRSQMSDSRQLNAALSGAGAPVTSINARHVMAYLAAYEHSFFSTIPLKKVTSRFGRGRSGGQFFLPGLSSEIDFAPAGPGDASLYRAYSSRRGELRVWSALMRELWREQLMIPQVAVLATLIPPLQRRLQIPNFILDIYGGTSTGKSTTLKVAASVYGNPYDPDSLVMQWTNTTAAVEQVAAMCSELPIFLDDAQHCPAELKRSLIYMIANGRGKGRGSTRGGISETATWHTVALSTSEEPLYEASPHEGARGRILSVGGHVPPFPSGSPGMVLNMERGAALNHGKAGETYIRHLNEWIEAEWAMWQKRYAAIRTELVRNCSSDLVGRVSGYISAIQLAAEIAGPVLGLEFKPDVVSAWLMLHLEEKQNEQNQVLAALRVLADHYVANIQHFAGDGNYLPERRLAIHGASKRQQYVGFLRSVIETVFKTHKLHPFAVLNKLAGADALCMTEKDRYTKKVTIEGVMHRMVCIKWSAILPEDTHSS